MINKLYEEQLFVGYQAPKDGHQSPTFSQTFLTLMTQFLLKNGMKQTLTLLGSVYGT